MASSLPARSFRRGERSACSERFEGFHVAWASKPILISQENPLTLIWRILTCPLRRPLPAVAIAALCAVLAALGAGRIHAEGSLSAMFARNDPAADALVHVLNDFDTADDLLVVASIPSNQPSTPGDVDRLLAFGSRLEDQILQDKQTRNLVDGVFFRPDAQGRPFLEKVVVPAALYY